MKRKTTEEFIQQSLTIHGDRYDYSKVEYKSNSTKVCITCKEHGEFQQTASSHLMGYGCWECGVSKRSKCRRDNQEDFLEKVKKVHGDKCLYNKVNYINSKTYVVITCKIHGDWSIKPNNILTGFGCPECGKIKSVHNRVNNILNKKFEGLIQPDDYKLIPLSQGKYTMVDNEDFEKLKDFNWSIINKVYVENREFGQIHRYIMNAPDNMLVDHKDGNPLNNRRSNLRLANHQQNMWNSKGRVGLKGVTLRKDTNRWSASITKDGVSYILGCFATEEEAGRAYDAKAKELFGEFAYLNFK